MQHSLQASTTAAPATSSCAQVTVDRMARVLTLDFGTAGCIGADGRVRKGRISARYQGDYQVVGSQTVVAVAELAHGNCWSPHKTCTPLKTRLQRLIRGVVGRIKRRWEPVE